MLWQILDFYGTCLFMRQIDKMKSKIKTKKLEKKKQREAKRIKLRKEENLYAKVKRLSRVKGTTIRKNTIIPEQTSE